MYKEVNLVGFFFFILFWERTGLGGGLLSHTPENARRRQDGVGELTTESSRVRIGVEEKYRRLEKLDGETKQGREVIICKSRYLLID